MSTNKNSLLGYLTATNPKIDATASSPGSNTRSSKNPWDAPRAVDIWEDFEYEALQSIYGAVLRQNLGQGIELEDITVPEIPFCQIHDEDSLETLLIKWTQSATSSALSVAQELLNVSDTHKIYMCRGGQAGEREKKKDRRPDWAAVKKSTIDGRSQGKVRNLLPGDTKLSKKWSSIRIKTGEIGSKDDDTTKDWFQPIAQIFTYCVRNGARYGYLITDKELVVVRVSPTRQATSLDSQSSFNFESIEDMGKRSKKAEVKRAVAEEPHLRIFGEGFLEYRAVPWSGSADGVHGDSAMLTVNLALWWLHMLAADDNTIKEHYTPLKYTKQDTNIDAGSRSSSSPLAEHSPKSQPVAQRSFTSGLDALGLGTDRPGKKRPRKNDVEDMDYVQKKSPQKRKPRGRR